MDFPYNIARGPMPERVPQGFIENSIVACPPVQKEVEGEGSGTKVPAFPVSQIVTPGIPQSWGEIGDLEPVVTDEEEVVRALWYLGKVGITDPRGVDVETKDVTEDFWRYACDVQQRVSGALESDNFRTQGQDGVEVDRLISRPCQHPGDLNTLRQASRTPWNVLTRVDSCAFFLLRATGCSSQCGRKLAS